jgi:hypothetical protein
VRGVEQPPAGGDSVHRQRLLGGVEQVAPAAVQPPVPDPLGGGGLLGLEQAMQARTGCPRALGVLREQPHVVVDPDSPRRARRGDCIETAASV